MRAPSGFVTVASTEVGMSSLTEVSAALELRADSREDGFGDSASVACGHRCILPGQGHVEDAAGEGEGVVTGRQRTSCNCDWVLADGSACGCRSERGGACYGAGLCILIHKARNGVGEGRHRLAHGHRDVVGGDLEDAPDHVEGHAAGVAGCVAAISAVAGGHRLATGGNIREVIGARSVAQRATSQRRSSRLQSNDTGGCAVACGRRNRYRTSDCAAIRTAGIGHRQISGGCR
jgi:hypothetical protein